jgi:molybdate transport system substrate-binding protein
MQWRLVHGLLAMALSSATAAQVPLQVYAAGSLREALTGIASAYESAGGGKVVLTFGASGLLRERIEKGEGAQVFASADMDHPQRLGAGGAWAEPVVFTRNQMCALAAPSVQVDTSTLLEIMLRPSVRVGTSTPKADPSGDYAWALFKRADAVKPGAFAALDAKALKLTGGADSPKPPPGRGTYAWVMDEGQADLFLTYCTNAVASQREVPRLKIIEVPPQLQVAAAYGLSVRKSAPQEAQKFADFLMSAKGQAGLKRLGFGQP